MKYAIITYKTKKSLSETLKNLMKEKPFSKITVSELTEKCNLNRKTFYYHFRDLRHLLKWTFENDAVSIIKEYSKTNNYIEAISFTIDYVERNKQIFNDAGNTLGRDDLINFFGSDLKEIFKNTILQYEQALNTTISEDYKDFLCGFFSEALVGQIALLLQNEKNYDKKQMIDYITLTISSSIQSVIKAFKATPHN